MAILSDLIVYQLADQLRGEAIRVSALESARHEYKLRDQIRAAAANDAMRLCIRLTPALQRFKRYLRNSKTPSF